MAQFKINLLTSIINTTSDVVKYLETPISEFYDQRETEQSKKKYELDVKSGWSNRKHVFCYTFDENVSFHTNGQKELSFSMIRDLWLDNELTTNPFVSKIKNGSQILLIDKYDNEYMFTVKDIKHTLKSNNVIYQYSCEDTFNYQHIRQHSGYSIDNNASEEDFIGAKTVDWWVVNKIQKDCHISYEYVPFSKGIYQAKSNNNLTIFNKNSSLKNVWKVVKPIYSMEEYPELYEKIPFSVSGSNAAASLISLAEELGLMLNYREQNIRDREGNRTNLFIRYFWFEPKHNEKTANLKYSPKINIQSFDFSHNGAALTTILNVDATEFEDESITLIPNIPPFFSNLFMSNSWESSQYTDGYFTSICQEQAFFCEEGLSANSQFGYEIDLQEEYSKGKSFYTNNYVYLCLVNQSNGLFKIPDYYEKVSLFNDKKETSLFINNQYYSSKNSKIEFVILNEKGEFIVYNNTFNPIPQEFLGEQKECYVRIRVDLLTRPILKESKILLSFSREATNEELEFAQMADLCPWLENKLIDFSYFLKQGVLSAAEYKVLLNTFKNDLRIINGKLLYYSKEYYRSIQTKTKQLVEITTTLDSLGAAFNSDIIEPFKTTGKIDDISYFREAYRTYQTKFNKEAVATPILNYNDLLSEYFDKYFKAQQRFLKNIYYFRQFFNQKIQWGEGVNVTQKTLTFKTITDFNLENNLPVINGGETIEKLDDNTYLRRYISFSKQPSFSIIDSNFKLYDENNLSVPVKVYLKDKISEATIVTKDNCTNFFTNKINEGDMVRCSTEDGYDSNKTYYRVVYKGSLQDALIENWPESFIDANNVWYRHHYDSDNVWYCSATPDACWGTKENPWPTSITTSITLNNTTKSVTLVKDFIPVSYKKIINDYIYNQLYNNNKIGWKIHNTNTEVSVSNWWNDEKIDSQLKLFHPTVFGNTFSSKDWENTSFKQLVHKIKTFFTSVDDNEENDERVNFYKAHFPITSVNYTGPNYIKNEYTWGARTYDYEPANKINKTFTNYLNYLKETIVNNNKNIAEVANPFDKTQYISRSIPLVSAETEAKYFRRVPKVGAVVAGGVAVALSGIWALVPIAGAGVLTLSALTAWAVAQASWYADTKWETSGVNTKDFYDRKFDENINYTGYHDSNKVIYTNSASSYDDWKAITKRREDNEFEISDVMISENTSPSGGWIRSNTSYNTTIDGVNKTFYLYWKKKNYSEIKNDYFDFFSKIALTYSSARSIQLNRDKTLTYTDSYLRFVEPEEKINIKGKYKVLLLKDSDSNNVVFVNNDSLSNGKLQLDSTNKRLSRILYYFIDNNCSDVDIRDIDIEITPCWKDYISNFVYSNRVYSVTASDKTIQFVLFQQEDFNRESIYKASNWKTVDVGQNEDINIIGESHRHDFYKGSSVYDNLDVEINFNQQGLSQGFYRVADGDELFVPIIKNDVLWKATDSLPSTKFFKEENGEYVRAYSILQIMQLKDFYYINNDFYVEDTLSNVYDFTTPIYLHQEKYVKKEENNTISWILDSSVDSTFIKEKHFTFNFFDKETQLEKKSIKFEVEDLDGLKYTRICDLSYPEGTPIGNISNGHFWCLYHSAINQPLLFETAAAIETELTQYWEQAYSASLYCEYFLPPSWQPQSDGDINYFNNNIITFIVKNNEETTDTTPTLSNKYLPEVSIFNNGTTSRIPLYQLKYQPKYDNSYSCDTDYQLINENHNTPAKNILSEHLSFIAAFEELNEDMENYVINNYNTDLNSLVKTTYYYSSNPNSGTKWKDFLQGHSSIPYNFNDYNGLYIMTYKILRQQFADKASSKYQAYKNRQSILWDSLYRQYPGVLLEDSYSNENATTSYDLYILAKNAFKDKQEPERGYSISLIDAYNSLLINTKTDNTIKNWTRYIGQELKIGEGILIDVEEYYNDYDDIYKSLSQYLFITDISYSLRKDSDIQITVNTIKYQDKLIQRLVKLIK